MRFNRMYLESAIYSIPESCNIICVYVDGVEIYDYVVDNNNLTLSENIVVNEYVNILFETRKLNMINYNTKSSVYSYFETRDDEDYLIEANNIYELLISGIDVAVEFHTQYSPFYCKERDVNRLISPILKFLNITEEELETEIFLVSVELNDRLFDEDTDWTEVNMKILAKLTASTVALNTVYKYYYTVVDEVGVNESRVGSLSESKERKAIILNDLIKRFQNDIDICEAQFTTKVISKAFTKASDSTTGLNDRVWG